MIDSWNDRAEFHFWFGAFSMIAGAMLMAVATGFLLFGQAAEGELIKLLSYILTVFFNLNGVALTGNGLMHWYVGYKA